MTNKQCSVSVGVKKDVHACIYVHPDLDYFGRSALIAAISTINVDVLDIFYGRRNVHLGVKGNLAHEVAISNEFMSEIR